MTKRNMWPTRRVGSGVLTPPCQWPGQMSMTTSVIAPTLVTSLPPQLVQGGSFIALSTTCPFHLLGSLPPLATRIVDNES